VEDKANGPAIISALRNKIPGMVAVEPDGDKVARAYAVTPMMEAGNVWLPHPAIAPWVEQLKLELLQFPFGANDDDVDALTQALRRMQGMVTHRPSRREEPRYTEASQVANQRRW
jgi:predicted phage terminase large subunit-like protein